MSAEIVIAACVKWAALHVEVDPVKGTVSTLNHSSGFSHADQAAVETALRLADAWSESGAQSSVVAICVGPSEADVALRDLLAVGVSGAVRVNGKSGGGSAEQLTSRTVARLLAAEVSSLGASVVVCGDVSADRGSGSVPAFVAHNLEAAQALGLIEVTPGSVGEISAIRRLDGARRELLSLSAPAVISVEGGVARLRRAALPDAIAARSVTIEVHDAGPGLDASAPLTSPWRPRTRVVPAPPGSAALERIAELTGARNEREPALTLHLAPAEAAQAILDQLAKWGYVPESTGDAEPGAGQTEQSSVGTNGAEPA